MEKELNMIKMEKFYMKEILLKVLEKDKGKVLMKMALILQVNLKMAIDLEKEKNMTKKGNLYVIKNIILENALMSVNLEKKTKNKFYQNIKLFINTFNEIIFYNKNIYQL